MVGAPYGNDGRIQTGAAYVFSRERTQWPQQDKLIPRDGVVGGEFGWSVALGADLAVIGAPTADGAETSSGAAYVFVREDASWSEHSKLIPADGLSGDGFGASVSVSGDYIVVGAPGDDRGPTKSGSVYLFVRTQDVGIEREKLHPREATTDAMLGFSTAVSGDIVLAGTPGDTENGPASGAAYAFHVDYTHTLTLSLIGAGSGSVSSTPHGIDCAPDCSEDFAVDTPVSLTPTPGSDSIFVAWSGDDDCTDGTVTMTGDLACTARFDLQAHELTVSKSGSGSGTVTSNPPGIECGTDCSET